VRWRPDKSPRQCTFEQLRDPARESVAATAVVVKE
jgi:hypothetical protein